MTKILQQTDGIIDFDILINGNKINNTVKVNELSIEMEVNTITSATLVIQDRETIGFDDEAFKNSESKDFIPGNDIEISLGYIDKTIKVFKGIIVSQRLTVKGDVYQLRMICKDKAINMTKGRYNSIFHNKTNSEALWSIVSKYGLKFKMDSTSQEHPILMQFNCSDWDYLVIKAEANSMLVTTYQNELSIKKIDFSTKANYEINSSQIIDIDLNLESENIPETFNMSSWDASEQKKITKSTKVKDALGQGNLSAEKISKIGAISSQIYSSTPIKKEEMNAWLESQADSAVLQKIQGKITIPGSAKIIAGDFIMLSGFSARFNGKAFISKVSHSLKDGQWLTELNVGKSIKPHAAFSDIEDIAASGLIPAVRGTQIARVKQIIEDPDNNYRVLVTLPSFTGINQEKGIWARLAIPYATKNAGFFFFPEKGDEVLLSFINNDPRFPIIMGSLYSSKNAAKETLNEKNQFKSIYSRSGINIRFDDENKILSIETPGNNNIILDDSNNNISIKDRTENSVIMDETGITIKTPKDINLNADGDINLKAHSNLCMKAKAEATLDGLSITQKARTSFTAKGNATAELSASGQTTLKGAMVLIN